MFSFPVTVPIRTPETILPLAVTVAIDDIACINSLDKPPRFSVSSNATDDYVPSSEIIFIDGRKLPVLETPAILNKYLDAYRSLDAFFTSVPFPDDEPVPTDNVVPLFQGHSCATSEGSTPD